jgi:hypothetical protein
MKVGLSTSVSNKHTSPIRSIATKRTLGLVSNHITSLGNKSTLAQMADIDEIPRKRDYAWCV